MKELELVVDDISTVDSEYQGLYEEREGKHHLTIAVKGMKPEAEFTRVHEALRKERTDHNKTREQLKPFAGLNIEEVQSQLARIPELEIAAEGKIDDKKVDKIVEQRIAGRLGPVQRERDTLKAQNEELTKVVDGYKSKDKTRTIHDAVRTAAQKAKVRDTAVEDALLYAERTFEVDESTGQVIAKDGVGVTPGIDPVTWLTEMTNKRPHWFAESVGGGAGGNRGAGGGGTTNPFTNEHWNLTEQGRLVRENRAQAENMAKAAGTSIGGGKPPPRK
jgi:hypothetical protein